MLTTKRPGKPLTVEDLAKVESQLEVTLPNDFRDFIRLQHEGVPEKRRFDFTDERGKSVGAVSRIVSFAPNSERNVVQLVKEIDGLPPKTIPFGDSGFGDYVCLYYGSQGAPKVVLYRHEYNEDECLLDLSSDFTGFTHLLRD